MSEAGKLRALLRQDGMIVAPGAYDGITARLIEQALHEFIAHQWIEAAERLVEHQQLRAEWQSARERILHPHAVR